MQKLYVAAMYSAADVMWCVVLCDMSQTALHWAAKHGREDMATAMADAGADINTKAVSPTEQKGSSSPLRSLVYLYLLSVSSDEFIVLQLR